MRTGSLIIGALIFALAAAAVLVWSGVLDMPGQAPTPTPQAATPAAQRPQPPSTSREAQMVIAMTQAAAGGGYAATFSDQDASKWLIAGGHRLERFSLEGRDTILARLSSSDPIAPTKLLDGLYVELPEQFTSISNGKKIEIGIVARTAKANSAESFSVIYLTRQAGNSGWQTFSLGPEFELKSIEFDVPLVEGGYNARPIVAIYGDPSGGGKGVELLGLYVKVKR